MTHCVVDQCTGVVRVKSLSLCSRHYLHHLSASADPCSTPQCDKPIRAKGLCATCYNRQRHACAPPCSVDGCAVGQHAAGLCQIHYKASVRYGLTPAEYDALAAESSGACVICGETRKKMVIDHDHASGKARGFLCQWCNVGLAHLEARDGGWLADAIRYLNERTPGGWSGEELIT